MLKKVEKKKKKEIDRKKDSLTEEKVHIPLIH